MNAARNPAAAHTTAAIYPPNALAAEAGVDAIDPGEARTLPGLFRARVARSADKIAYIEYHPGAGRWREYAWREMAAQVERWRRALAADGFRAGERAAIRLANGRHWVLFDQACLAAGMVVAPLYAKDSADNIAYILQHTEARLLLLDDAAMWQEMRHNRAQMTHLKRVLLRDEAAGGESAGSVHVNEASAGDIEAATGAHVNAASAGGGESGAHSADDEAHAADHRVLSLSRWLDVKAPESAASAAPHADAAAADSAAARYAPPPPHPDDLATIVYTSGTTGRPKGVMLSHANVLRCAHASLKSVAIFRTDKFLSFLPLSHTFERTVGYYLPMMAAASVAFNRSITQLPEDLGAHRPTAMITVPHIFERVQGAIVARLEQGPAWRRGLYATAVAVGWRRFEIAQGRAAWHPMLLLWPLLNAVVANNIRARFGGRLRLAISGGARLAPATSKPFIAFGLNILQGYGLTETGPTLSVNTLARNLPSSIGMPLLGAEIRLSASGELQARSASVMRGYWRDAQATRQCLDADGWFASGDIARIDGAGFIHIIGRLKEIIVTATGEKVPPADMEAAICAHPLFDQAMVVGEGRPYLAALIVLNPFSWPRYAEKIGLDPHDAAVLSRAELRPYILDIIATQLRDFPGYAAVRRVCLLTEPWSVACGAMTPTLKLKRPALRRRFEAQLRALYAQPR